MPSLRLSHVLSSPIPDRSPSNRTLLTACAIASLCVISGGTFLAVELTSSQGGFVAIAIAFLTLGVTATIACTARAVVGHPPETIRPQVTGTAAPVLTGTQLMALWEKSPLSIMLFEPNDPLIPVKIVDCNPTACEMHGYRREELVGQCVDVIEGTPWAKLYGQGWISELRLKHRLEGSGRHRRKDGTVFEIEYFTSLIDLNGRELVIGMDRDATARCRAERALRESEERWQLAVAGSDEGVWVGYILVFAALERDARIL